MDDALESKCKVECKIATIIAAYSAQAFCRYPKMTHKPVVHASGGAPRGKPGMLRKAWEAHTTGLGIRAGTVAFMKGMK